MKLFRFAGLVLLSATLTAATATPSWAQSSYTNADIQRLQDGINEASNDVAQVRSRDASLASQLQSDLDELRDETTYLRMKLRHNEPISSSDYNDVRDRIDEVRSRARGDASGRYSTPSGSRSSGNESNHDSDSAPRHASNPNEVPNGTEFDVRLQTALSSATAQPEDRFDATTVVDLRDERGKIIVPAGSTMRGIVNSVHKATRTERTGKMTIAFDRMTVGGHSYPIRATVTQAIESEGIRGEAGKIGIGAGAGAIIGAILGGAKGALAGILIGGGGTVAATEGKDVELPAGTVLRVRLDEPIQLNR